MHKNVSTIVLNRDHTHILLLLREDLRRWTLPGGRLEDGEMLKQAAIRETFEETGYEVAIDRLVGEYARPTMPNGGDIKYIFLGHVIGGAPIQSGPETLGVAWFSLDNLPTRLVFPRFTREYIQDALASGPHPVKKTLYLPRWQSHILAILVWLRDLRNRLTGHP